MKAADPGRRVTVVGLGPGPWELMSVRAARVLEQARRLVLRTRRHPVAADLEARGIPYVTFDEQYQRCEDFDQLYRLMASTLLEMAREEPVVYGVPGHPLVGEASVRQLLGMAAQAGVDVELVVSPGSPDAVWAELGIDPLEDGTAVLDAHEVARWAQRPDALAPPSGRAWERTRGFLVLQLDSRLAAQEVKAALSWVFGDQHRVALVRSAGGSGRVEWLPLFELDRRGPFDHETSLYVPPVRDEAVAAPGELAEVLVRIMAALRSPQGCPWDRQQTHESLRRYLIEEAYEAVAAVEKGDLPALRDELGDLLLQVLFHAQLAFEEGAFTIADVEAGLREKLVRRHPHVFGQARVKDAAEVLRNWDAIKQKEREAAGGAGEEAQSLMDGLVTGLPALTLAEAVQRRAARVRFEWREISGAGRKAVEEAQELRAAWMARDRAALHRELGDLLFAIVNVSRYMKVDPELALRDAAMRFAARFRRMEQLAREQGLRLEEMDLEAQDALWNRAKEDVGR